MASLGSNHVLILRNHGVLATGATVAKAFQRMYFFEQSAQLQLDVMQTGRPICMPSPEVCEKTAQSWHNGTSDSSSNDDIEWAALLRLADTHYPGFRA